MIDSKTTFLLKWAGFESKVSDNHWNDGNSIITISHDSGKVGFSHQRKKQWGRFCESTPENLNRDLQNFLKKYMRENGIESPPKLSKAQEVALLTSAPQGQLNVKARTYESLLDKGLVIWNCVNAYELTDKGRILAEYLKEKV